MKERFRNQVKNCKTYPGADIDSDHNLVVMHCELKFKKLAKKSRTYKLNVDRLKCPEVQHRLRSELNSHFSEKSVHSLVDEEWGEIKTGLIQ